MKNSSPIILRAHTESANEHKKSGRRKKEKPEPKWPASILVLDCETRTDERQSLTFGTYRICCADEQGNYNDVREEGFFYDPDEVTKHELRTLKRFAKEHKAETTKDVPDVMHVRTRHDFLKEIFLPLGLNGALIVGFNLPFDLSRLAEDARQARRLNDDWSFVMLHEDFCPRIIVTRKDGKIAFFRFSGVKRNPKTGKKIRLPRGRFLDVRTLAWALRNVSYSLRGLCEALTIPGKLDHKPSGKITEAEINYARQDVRATVGALNALRAELDRYPIQLHPDHAYSPASIVKAYFAGMGITLPSKKFRLSPKVQGIVAQSFYGGRAECRIRRMPVPVVHTDFKSEYPTVITLMGLSRLVIAKRLRITKATREVRSILEDVTLDKTFDPRFWKRLNCFALVQPDGDVLPVRTEYDSDSGENNVGVNILTSTKPIWYALPDLIASKLFTGRTPKILRAICVVGEGTQVGLKPTYLGETEINPKTGDFFKTVIETRERVKRDERLPESERKTLGYFLKIMANAGYGIFIETTPKRVPGRKSVQVFSGEFNFPTTSAIVEDKGPWYCPLIASLITSAGRLFLAMLEAAVKELGGTHLFADTDSMAIVATKGGGLIPCVGGPHRLSDGREAVRSLSWAEVQQTASRFNRLNPYDKQAVPSILKVEDVNYDNGAQREIEGYAISAKRYTFFTRTSQCVRIITPSEHGLGHLFVPKSDFDEDQGAKSWVIGVWLYLVRMALGLKHKKPLFFALPAMMKFAITTPDVFQVLQRRQLEKGLSYRDRVKPFNFILSPMINRQVFGLESRTDQTVRLGYPSTVDPEHFMLIAPFTEDTARWYKMPWINVHDGRWFYLAPLAKKQRFEASPFILDDVIGLFHVHPESKSVASDGTPCGWHTAGLLQRSSVIAGGFDYIGKETDRKWEQEEDISMLSPTLPSYRQSESARLEMSSVLQIKVRSSGISVRDMARRTRLSTRTVRAARNGKRIRKLTALKFEKALREQEIEELETEE